MRNLGLALMLVGTILVPHAAQAKKHEGRKSPRSVKPREAPPKAQERRARERLETAVAQDEPQPTAIARLELRKRS